MPDILTTKSFWDLKSAEDKRIVVLEGGARSGKTWSVAQYLALLCMSSKKPLRIVVARDYLVNLRKILLPDFRRTWTSMSCFREADLNKSDSIYTMNGSEILFSGLLDSDSTQKMHGFALDYVFINEASSIPWEPVNQMLMRLEGQLIVDLNPNASLMHWVYSRIKKRPDHAWFHSTIKDNPFAPQSVVNEIMAYEPTPENYARGTADPVSWSVYGLGVADQVRGLVFDSYELVDEIPAESMNWCGGIDPGFSSDPTAVVMKSELGGQLFLKELVYARGLATIHNPGNPDRQSIEGELLKARFPKNMPLYIDNADPRLVSDLRSRGWWAEPVVKGPGSVIYGIDVMRRYKLRVTRDSVNLIKELSNYRWALDREGTPTGVPVKGGEHAIDASRYSAVMSCGKSAYRTGRFEGCRVSRELIQTDGDDWDDVAGGSVSAYGGAFDLRMR